MPRYRFDERQVGALLAYMMSRFQDGEPPPPQKTEYVAVTEGEQAARRILVRKYGCYGCHDIPGFDEAAKVGAELNTFADKEVERLDFGTYKGIAKSWYSWMKTKLRSPRVFRDSLKMPDFDFTEDEIEALTVFLASLSRLCTGVLR